MPISRPAGLAAVLAALAAVVGCSDEGPDAAIVSEATDWPWQTSPPTPTSAPVVSETQAPTVAVTTAPTVTQEPVSSLTEPPVDASPGVAGGVAGGGPTDDPASPSAAAPAPTPPLSPTPSEASEQPRDDDESSSDWFDLIRIALTGSDG